MKQLGQAGYGLTIQPVPILALPQARRNIQVHEALVEMERLEKRDEACGLQRVGAHVELDDGEGALLLEYISDGLDPQISNLIVTQIIASKVRVCFQEDRDNFRDSRTNLATIHPEHTLGTVI